MFIDTGTLLAIIIAQSASLAMMLIMFRSAYKWEQAYHNTQRVLKQERVARNYNGNN